MRPFRPVSSGTIGRPESAASIRSRRRATVIAVRLVDHQLAIRTGVEHCCLETKAPCKPCNEGWMERLETETRPILIPMLDDRTVVLGGRAQGIQARWATLRTLMPQHGHPAGK